MEGLQSGYTKGFSANCCRGDKHHTVNSYKKGFQTSINGPGISMKLNIFDIIL